MDNEQGRGYSTCSPYPPTSGADLWQCGTTAGQLLATSRAVNWRVCAQRRPWPQSLRGHADVIGVEVERGAAQRKKRNDRQCRTRRRIRRAASAPDPANPRSHTAAGAASPRPRPSYRQHGQHTPGARSRYAIAGSQFQLGCQKPMCQGRGCRLVVGFAQTSQSPGGCVGAYDRAISRAT
jgi:hypothetical protein